MQAGRHIETLPAEGRSVREATKEYLWEVEVTLLPKEMSP